MVLTALMTKEQVVTYLQMLVQASNPLANVEPGSPIYDWLVNSFADIITEERKYTSLVRDLSQVFPLFNDDGTLISADFADYIINKYFIATENITKTINTISLYFTQRCDVEILQGSSISYSGIIFEIDPLSITSYSTDWKTDRTGNYIALTALNADNTSYNISTTQSWSLADLNYTISSATPSTILFARNTSTVANTQKPVLTLDVLKNSISNRSMSNARGIKYNIKVNSGFTPTSLKQYLPLKYNDRFYIDNYIDVVNTSVTSPNLLQYAERIAIKAPGKGKILMDYGNSIQYEAFNMQYLGPINDGYFFSEGPVISGDTDKCIQTLYLTGVTTANSDAGTLYWQVVVAAPNVTLELCETFSGSVVAVSDIGDTTISSGQYLLISESAGSGISGYVMFKYTQAFAVDASRKIQYCNSAYYKIPIENTKGVMSPIAIVYNDVEATSYSLATSVYNTVANYDSVSQPTTSERTKILIQHTALTVVGDTNSDINWIELTGLTVTNTNFFNLYWELDSSVNKIYIYKSEVKALADLVAYCDLTSITTAYNTETILPLNSSGIGGFCSARQGASNKADENRIIPGNAIVGFSNDAIYLQMYVTDQSANYFHNKTCYIIYAGTNSSMLTSSQATLDEPDNRELTSSILVSPYRPFSISIPFDPNYIFPYHYSAVVFDNYKKLIRYLENYFSNYVGTISDINFADLSSTAFSATGLYFKLLDYTVATQRGHLVTGQIDIGSDTYKNITWATDIVSYIATAVDPYYSSYLVNESSTTVEQLYKPVMSRCRI